MPTTNPVPSNDPTDLLFNAQKLDQVVNGSDQYYTDRLGVNRRTVAGISAAADVVLGGLGYAPPVTYASGISMTLTTQTVEYSGEIYAPKVASLPFTTSTWATDSAKFRLIQGVAATDLAASGSAGMIGYMPEGTGAVATTVQEKLRESVSVKDFGAVGDGVTDDTAAIQAAVNASKSVIVPAGKYKLTSPVQLQSNGLLSGAGKGVWEPYTGGALPDIYKTEFIVGAHAAFLFSGTNNAKVRGLSIKSTGGTQSAFGSPAGYMAGSIGFNITNSKSADMEDVSGHGLEFLVAASHVTDGGEASMFRLNDFIAVDCDTVVRVGNPSSADMFRARDFMVSDCVIALHCNHMMEVHGADGVTVNMCRFFQAYDKSLYFRNCAFVQLSAVTTFETANDGLTFKDCYYVSCGAMIISRTGGYSTGAWIIKNAVTVDNTKEFSFQGIVEQPAWRAFVLTNSEGIQISGAVRRPFYTYGNLGTGGAVQITTCKETVLNIAFNDFTAWFAVEADPQSAATLSGKIGHPQNVGVSRAYLLSDKVWTHIFASDLAFAPGGSSAMPTPLRVKVPAGKKLVTRSVYMTSSQGMILRLGDVFWNANYVFETGGEHLCTQQRTLYDNSAGGTDVYAKLSLSLHNDTAGTITVPAGHVVYVSYALE